MNYIVKIVKKLLQNEEKVLGRWNIDYSYQIINRKIDLSNQDNCGVSRYIILNKSIKNTSYKNIEYINK